MKVKKKEKLVIEFSIDDALKMQAEFEKVNGITDDMILMELIERLEMVL